MALVNNIQADILENLGRFGYLAVSQFQFLTGKSLGYLREQLAILCQRSYIKSYHVEITGKVRAENIYYLTTLGRDFLLTHEKVFADDIKLPVGTPLVVRDYHHRKNFIDLHIALYNCLNVQAIELVTFLTYFDKQGNNRKDKNLESKTKLSLGGDLFYIPDGIMVTEQGETRTLYLLEMYNGKDTIRTIQQLAKHAKVITLGTASNQFEIAANPLVLCAFEHGSIKQAVVNRLEQNDRFTSVSKLFFFASLEDVKKDCGNAWQTIAGEKLRFKC